MSISSDVSVFERIRHAILAGVWPPGHRLAPVALSQRFDTSTPVVREALTRMVGENLVVSKTNRGFFVPKLELREFRDITELRCITEALALRLAIERGDLQWETELIAAHHRLARTPRRNSSDPERISDDWSVVHRAFHQALIIGCQCEPMIRIANNLSQSTDLYRCWAAPAPGTLQRDVEQEHRDILDAVLQRDAARAGELLRNHYEETARMVLVAGLVK